MSQTNQQGSSFLSWHSPALILGALALICSGSAVLGQSSDRDTPSPLTSNDIRGAGIGKQAEFFYTFLAGPGEVTLTTDARARAYSTFFEVMLFNMDAQEVGVVRYGPTMRSERRVTRISNSAAAAGTTSDCAGLQRRGVPDSSDGRGST
jgi:hypothetical protein